MKLRATGILFFALSTTASADVITFKELSSIVNTCANEQIENVIRQYFILKGYAGNEYDVKESQQTNSRLKDEKSNLDSISFKQQNRLKYYSSNFHFGVSLENSTMEFTIKSKDNELVLTEDALPYVSYHSSDKGIDPFGVPDENYIKISEITLVNPTMGEHFLKNKVYNTETQIKLSTDDYLRCLKTSLEKSSVKINESNVEYTPSDK